MFKILKKSLMLISVISLPLFANSNSFYDDAFQALSNTPVTQLDLKIAQLNAINIDCFSTMKLMKIVNNESEEDGKIINYQTYSTPQFINNIKSTRYFKDDNNCKCIICVVLVDFSGAAIKEKVEEIKYIHQMILEIIQTNIHHTFDQSCLKVIVKKQKPIRCRIQSKEKRTDDYFWNNSKYYMSLPNPEEDILVIWENGLPHYQEAFFED